MRTTPRVRRVARHELLTGLAHLPEVLSQAGRYTRLVGNGFLAYGEHVVAARLLGRGLVDLLRKRRTGKHGTGKDGDESNSAHRKVLRLRSVSSINKPAGLRFVFVFLPRA